MNQLLLLLLLVVTTLCRLLWCMRVLSGLAAAGLKLDKFGVLQLCTPGLSDVLMTQLGVVAVLQTFLKRTVSSRSIRTAAGRLPHVGWNNLNLCSSAAKIPYLFSFKIAQLAQARQQHQSICSFIGF